jgi:hypothetical protein
MGHLKVRGRTAGLNGIPAVENADLAGSRRRSGPIGFRIMARSRV